MKVIIRDVGPRDGLQSEKALLSPALRAELIGRLGQAGVPAIEAVSFVNPKLVPSMDGAENVFSLLPAIPGASYSALVLNERGYDRAAAAGVAEIRYGLAATDEFGQRNQNQAVAQSLEVAARLIRRAHDDHKIISVAISVAFGCPFVGKVQSGDVLKIVEKLMEDGPDEISLADTIGVGVPTQVRELVAAVRSIGASTNVHFHNTRNMGYANAAAALEAGAVSMDASLGGIGGCPFAPRATGNIATEDLVYMLHGMGVATGIDLAALVEISHWLGGHLGKELPSLVSRAGSFSAGIPNRL
jgi:hydroxymethylglutaryl-CoA lyase/(R)-citramalyl-CoA lyase